MIAFTKKQLGAFVRITVLTALCAICTPVFAGYLSSDETHSYDGSFNLVIDPAAWVENEDTDEKKTLSLYEARADLVANDPVFSEEILIVPELSKGTLNYSIFKSENGTYKYILKVCSDYMETTSGGLSYPRTICSATDSNAQNDFQSTVVKVDIPLDDSPDERLDLSDYDIYYGDFNGDGVSGDIYFYGRDVFVLIAGDI